MLFLHNYYTKKCIFVEKYLSNGKNYLSKFIGMER